MARARVSVVIPARMASSRFPDKPLALILGIPMVEHVRRRAALAQGVEQAIVATCDEPIRSVVERSGGIAVMTADTHERATDRVAEAVRGRSADVVVMVQGDEPLLLPDAVRAAAAPLLEDPRLECTNLLSPLASDTDLGDPDIVKAVCARNGDILFLTRASIPFRRVAGSAPVFRQTGIMAFRSGLLSAFPSLEPTPLEQIESIDMLRLLEHGHRIRGVVLPYVTLGVDRPEDIGMVEDVLRADAGQRELYERIRMR